MGSVLPRNHECPGMESILVFLCLFLDFRIGLFDVMVKLALLAKPTCSPLEELHSWLDVNFQRNLMITFRDTHRPLLDIVLLSYTPWANL